MSIKQFNSFDELQEELRKNRQAYNEKHTNMKNSGNLENLEVGDFVSRDSMGITIVGRLTNPLDWYEGKEVGKDYDQEEYNFEKDSYAGQVEHGMVFGKFYSEMCPEGELGYAPVTELQKITEEVFNSLSKEGR
jgi:hypothetical protein